MYVRFVVIDLSYRSVYMRFAIFLAVMAYASDVENHDPNELHTSSSDAEHTKHQEELEDPLKKASVVEVQHHNAEQVHDPTIVHANAEVTATHTTPLHVDAVNVDDDSLHQPGLHKDASHVSNSATSPAVLHNEEDRGTVVDDSLHQPGLHKDASHNSLNEEVVDPGTKKATADLSKSSSSPSVSSVAVQTVEEPKTEKKEPRGDRLVVDGVETNYDIEPREMISILEREMRLGHYAVQLNYKLAGAGALVADAAARIMYLSSLADLTSLIILHHETLKDHVKDATEMISATMAEIDKTAQ